MNSHDDSVTRGATFLDVEAAKLRAANDSDVGGNDRPPIVALEIGELLAHPFPPQEAIFGPWLRKQTLAMVHAWRGVGKTHFAIGVAYAAASGGGFLKWQSERPCKVLYIDGEMPGAAIKERLAAVVASREGEREPPPGFFRIVTPDAQQCALPDLGTASGQAAFDAVLGDAELIVIDNLSSLSRVGPENEGESWLPIASWALARRREGRAVLFVHHEGKNGQQRGSSRREDLLDVVMSLNRPSDYSAEEGARFIVKFRKARGLRGDEVEDIEASLGIDAAGIQQWTWRGAEVANDSRIQELLKLGMTNTEVAAEIGCHRSTVFRARKKLEAEGVPGGHHGTA